MSNQWQDKTRNGRPVKVTRRIADGPYALEGEVAASDGGKMIMTWTDDGHHVHGKKTDFDLMPLESPAETPPDTAKVQAHNRMVLALAATQYKRACDAVEAACEAQGRANKALRAAMQNQKTPNLVVNIDKEAFLFRDDELIIGCYRIEVL